MQVRLAGRPGVARAAGLDEVLQGAFYRGEGSRSPVRGAPDDEGAESAASGIRLGDVGDVGGGNDRTAMGLQINQPA